MQQSRNGRRCGRSARNHNPYQEVSCFELHASSKIAQGSSVTNIKGVNHTSILHWITFDDDFNTFDFQFREIVCCTWTRRQILKIYRVFLLCMEESTSRISRQTEKGRSTITCDATQMLICNWWHWPPTMISTHGGSSNALFALRQSYAGGNVFASYHSTGVWPGSNSFE